MKTKTYNELKQKIDELERRLNGGAGSGNFGHSGRPGKVGGSGKTPTNIYSQKFKDYAERKCKAAGKNLAHPELAYIYTAVVKGYDIDWDKVKNEPAIQEAVAKAKFDKDTLTEYAGDAKRKKLQDSLEARLLDNKTNGSARMGKNGKLEYTGKVDNNKEAWIVIGPPAAGKSSVFADPISRDNNARIIDSDTVKKWLPEFDNGFGAGRVQEESAMIMERALDKAVAKGENIVIPKIGGNSIENIAKDLKSKGYTVHLNLNEVKPSTSVSRALSRFVQEGRYLDINYLLSIGDKATKTFKRLAQNKELVDDAVWKNNDVPYGHKPKTVLTYKNFCAMLDKERRI